MWHGIAALLLLSAPPVDRYFQDPHPMRTMFRGPVLRLLDDPQTRLTLELDSQQSSKLVEFLRDLDRKQDEFFLKTEEDLQARLQSLSSKMETRQRAFLNDFEKAVGVAAKKKLIGRALHFWGDLAPFAVGVAEEIGVTRSQRTAAEEALRRYEKKRVELSTGEVRPQELDLVAQAMGAELGKLLTTEQRQKRDELAGPKPTWAPELFVEREAARDERESRPPFQRIHRDPKRLLRLVQVDDVLDILRIQGDERRSLLQWAKDMQVEEDKLAVLVKNDTDTLQERNAKLATFDEKFDQGLAAKLGSKKIERLQQIRWQLAGVGAVFGDALRKELGITDAQFHGALARLQEESNKRADEDAKINDETELRKRRSAQERALTDTLLGALSEQQKKKWRQLLGEPLDKNQLSRISRRL